MSAYTRVLTQGDMDRLLGSIAGFHDSLTKEIHLVNRAYVRPDQSMVMSHRYDDAQVLIQSQWEPFAMELVFCGIHEMGLGAAGEYWGATGLVELRNAPVKERRIRMAFDRSLIVVSEELLYRVRSEWLGKRSFLRSEVPSESMVRAIALEDKWRQCSECSDAWEEEPTEEVSLCPSCGSITHLHHCDA